MPAGSAGACFRPKNPSTNGATLTPGSAGGDGLFSYAARRRKLACRPPAQPLLTAHTKACRTDGASSACRPERPAGSRRAHSSQIPRSPIAAITHGHLRYRPAPRKLGRVVVVAVADVVGDQVLERLEALEQLLGVDRLLGLVGPDQPGSGLGRGLPADLLGLGGAALGDLGVVARDRLDPVEVDVREAVALCLVILDPRTVALGRLRGGADLLAEGRVLAPLSSLTMKRVWPDRVWLSSTVTIFTSATMWG